MATTSPRRRVRSRTSSHEPNAQRVDHARYPLLQPSDEHGTISWSSLDLEAELTELRGPIDLGNDGAPISTSSPRVTFTELHSPALHAVATATPESLLRVRIRQDFCAKRVKHYAKWAPDLGLYV